MSVALTLVWFCLGAVSGLVAYAADLRPVSSRIGSLLYTVILGGSAAFGGGVLGILFLGRPFATAMALWVAVVGVVCIPWLLSRMRHRTLAT